MKSYASTQFLPLDVKCTCEAPLSWGHHRPHLCLIATDLHLEIVQQHKHILSRTKCPYLLWLLSYSCEPQGVKNCPQLLWVILRDGILACCRRRLGHWVHKAKEGFVSYLMCADYADWLVVHQPPSTQQSLVTAPGIVPSLPEPLWSCQHCTAHKGPFSISNWGAGEPTPSLKVFLAAVIQPHLFAGCFVYLF